MYQLWPATKISDLFRSVVHRNMWSCHKICLEYYPRFYLFSNKNDFSKDISRVRPKVSKEDSKTMSAIPAFLLRNYCLLGQIRRIILVKCAKMQAMFYCKIFNIYGAKMLGKVTNFPRMKLQWNSWVKKRLPPITWG